VREGVELRESNPPNDDRENCSCSKKKIFEIINFFLKKKKLHYSLDQAPYFDLKLELDGSDVMSFGSYVMKWRWNDEMYYLFVILFYLIKKMLVMKHLFLI